MFKEICLVLVLILVNGALAMTEIAVVTSRVARVRHRARHGNKAYKALLPVVLEPTPLMSTITVGITLIGILAGAFGGATISHDVARTLVHLGLHPEIAETLSLALVVLLTTMLSVVFGELIPKRIGMLFPEPIAAFMQFPVRVISAIFWPLVKLLSGITTLALRLLGIKNSNSQSITEEDIRILVSEGARAGVLDRLEQHLVEHALDLADRRVTTVMRPRRDIPVLDTSATPEEFKAFVMENAREDALPVIEEGMDHVVGMLDIRASLLSLLRSGTIDKSQCIRVPSYIPASFDALKALRILAARSTPDSVIVVDEYGGVEGLLCLEDILAALVPESADGHMDPHLRMDEPPVVDEVDGALVLSDLLRLYNLSRNDVPETVDTLGGLMQYLYQGIPETGTTIDWQDLRFVVTLVELHRVVKVRIVRPSGRKLL